MASKCWGRRRAFSALLACHSEKWVRIRFAVVDSQGNQWYSPSTIAYCSSPSCLAHNAQRVKSAVICFARPAGSLQVSCRSPVQTPDSTHFSRPIWFLCSLHRPVYWFWRGVADRYR
jgi:hypothetical protein